jgi:hypothetical protein
LGGQSGLSRKSRRTWHKVKAGEQGAGHRTGGAYSVGGPALGASMTPASRSYPQR